jgi:K+-transporting ATPase ATPase A chain
MRRIRGCFLSRVEAHPAQSGSVSLLISHTGVATERLLLIGIHAGVLLIAARPIGAYLARVYAGEATLLGRILGPVERVLCRLAGVPPGPAPLPAELEMSWQQYVLSLFAFNGAVVLAALVLRGMLGSLSLNLAGLVLVKRFLSAGSGLVILLALVRGLRRRPARTVGNFWVDLIRGTLYILLPLALLVALLLLGQKGVLLLARLAAWAL